ncbi:MAG: YicC family protein [Minwuia sp.]|nr:YicC family protein [Minwuia sp.]
MAITSMTGFARREGVADAWKWVWEARSVNGKGLDVRYRLPSAFDTPDSDLKRKAQALLSRGNVSISLHVDRDKAAEGSLTINRNWLQALREEAVRHADGAPVDIAGLFAVRGVVEVVEQQPEEDEFAHRDKAILADHAGLLTDLVKARDEEGARLQAIIASLIDEIETQVAEAATAEAARPGQRRVRLQAALQELLAMDPPVTEERLAQELALQATRGDIREELDRLTAHIAQARDLLVAGEPVGRRLDFLSQEFNREANTLCSKSGDVTLTRVGMAMKATIDRLREQVQNVE